MFTLNLHQKLFILVILFLVISCSKSSKLETALELAGDNRAELEKVLEHYKKDPADELKYKAACYMIENMQWHYGKQVQLSEEFWELFIREDSLVTLMLQDNKKEEHRILYSVYNKGKKEITVNKAIAKSVTGGNYQPDLLVLDADFLIQNIDAAFEVKKNDLCKTLSFIDFCEYILPYRVNSEPVYPVRKKLQEHFLESGILDSLQQDQTPAVNLLTRYASLFSWEWSDKLSNPDLGFYNLFYWNHISCGEVTASYNTLLRSAGLPVSESFTPKWRDANGGHIWTTLLKPDGELDLFTSIYQKPGGLTALSPLRATKIFRNTFSPQSESPYFLKASGEELPLLFNSPCIEDITSRFLPVMDVEVKLQTKLKENNLCWFAVFKTGDWMPVGWGKLNGAKNRVLFKDISVGLTGVACYYDGYSLIPCSKLITVHPDGMKYIESGKEKINLRLTRKYPVNTRLQNMRKEIAGTKIKGANRPDFSDTVTVHVIRDTLQPYFQDILFDEPGSYRYYRIESPGWHLNIAELEFITHTKSPGLAEASLLPVFEKNQPAQEVMYKIPYSTLPEASDSTLYDGDILTFCNRKRIGLDLGKPQSVNRIRMAARTAHNGIVPGDNYQLFYWENEWVSAGMQQAKYNFLEFNDVPANTLYWLRNHDHGKEEQPFFYENGKQVFMNQPISSKKGDTL